MRVALGMALGFSLDKGLKILDTAANITNAGVNAYAVSRSGGGGGGTTQQVVHNHIQERQLTPEEIKMLQEKHAEELKNSEFSRAMQMQQSADMRRFMDKNINGEPTKNDNTMIYGVVAIVLVAIVFKSIKK